MPVLLNGQLHWKKICKRGHMLTDETRDQDNHCIPCRRIRSARRARFQRYGLSYTDYNQMRVNQNFACAICERQESEFSTSLVIDHDHKTGKTRGLLCRKCNGVLVMYLETQPQLFYKAKAYLNRYKDVI